MRSRIAALGAVAVALALGACGSDDEGEAAVGACVDAENSVVDCGSGEAAAELVSDLSAEDAIACVEIGDVPQTTVEVDGTEFCAEPFEAAETP